MRVGKEEMNGRHFVWIQQGKKRIVLSLQETAELAKQIEKYSVL